MSTLYIVSTPIGNLSDITLRAIETLKMVDMIACEDTRHSLRLLNHLGIRKPLVSCRSQNENYAAEKICAELEKGKSVAYVSDAGTPGVSDPGARLVSTVREQGYKIIPIPGPSALTALISVCGYSGKTFTFEGFLSPKSGRRKNRLKELLEREESFILYESPFRIVKLIDELAGLEPTRRVIVGRELTKTFEELIEGTAEDVKNDLSSRENIKGELVVLVSGQKKG